MEINRTDQYATNCSVAPCISHQAVHTCIQAAGTLLATADLALRLNDIEVREPGERSRRMVDIPRVMQILRTAGAS